MNSREKTLNALKHRDGPVPIDFGATSVTGLHASCVEALREYYGLDKHPVKIIEPYQMLGMIEDDLIAEIGIDTLGIFPPTNMFGFTNDNWKEWRTPWEQTVLVPGKFHVKREGSDLVIFPEGDFEAAPSGRMPENGFFFDAIIRQPEIDETRLTVENNLEEFGIISDSTLNYFQDAVTEAEAIGRCIVATFGGTALGDVALIPATFLKQPRGIRDVTEWYVSLAARQDFVHELFARQVEYALENLSRIYHAVGNAVDVVFICGTDFGTQTGTFCSEATFNELWLPYYRKINDWIHQNTTWKTFKHSCGAVEPLMRHFIEAGFDIINPVQCSATGMVPEELKRQYGSKLVFWGGGVDTQHVLPFGTPQQVREQVLRRCDIFSKDGGFVFNAIHNVQALTPVENIVAMLDAVKSFNTEAKGG